MFMSFLEKVRKDYKFICFLSLGTSTLVLLEDQNVSLEWLEKGWE